MLCCSIISQTVSPANYDLISGIARVFTGAWHLAVGRRWVRFSRRVRPKGFKSWYS